jgi:hypothetical protein
MMSKAYPDIDGTDLAIQHLLKGIPDQQMAYEISVRTPRSVSEAVDMIIMYEACKNNTRRRNDIRNLTTSFTDYEYSEDSEDDMPSDLRRINGKRFVTEERLYQFARDLKQPLMRKNTFNEERYNEKEKSSRTIDTIICYHCHEEGHIAPKCPEKRNNNEENSQKSTSNTKGLSLLAESQSKQ